MDLRVFNCLLMLLGLCVVIGCTPQGRSNVETVSVSGKVTVDGQPAEGLSVRFFSSSMMHEGVGITGPDGTYELGNGAEPGENKVYFVKVDSTDEDEEVAGAGDTEADPDDTGDEAEAEGGLPAKYNSPETTEVTFTVAAGGSSDASFELTTK